MEDKNMRYRVLFNGCTTVVEFDNLQDARHYARLNGGMVFDTETWEEVYNYSEVCLDY